MYYVYFSSVFTFNILCIFLISLEFAVVVLLAYFYKLSHLHFSTEPRDWLAAKNVSIMT